MNPEDIMLSETHQSPKDRLYLTTAVGVTETRQNGSCQRLGEAEGAGSRNRDSVAGCRVSTV